MARRKKPAFDGLALREAEAKAAARAVRDRANAFAALDRVRTWAREGRTLLADMLAKFEDLTPAVEGSEEAERLLLLISGGLVRDFPEGQHPLNLIDALARAEAIVRELDEMMPSQAQMSGDDATDEVMRGSHTVEEIAIALDTSEGAIEKRRTRRRR